MEYEIQDGMYFETEPKFHYYLNSTTGSKISYHYEGKEDYKTGGLAKLSWTVPI